MPERFVDLSVDDRRDALEVAAQSTGRPAYLLEKDVWVVWSLEVLFRAEFRDVLVFKGGTSLSKAFGIIDRFSEDVDLTYDIRRLIPDLATDSEIPPSRSQADRWTAAVRDALPQWLDEHVVPTLGEAAASVPGLRVERTGTDVRLSYRDNRASDEYVQPRVLLEFGARSTGEPNEGRSIACDAASGLPDVVFPTADVRAMKPTRTFWEKATAAHAYYVQLALAMAAKALGSKAASSKRREFNPATAKYDFRVVLLHLGLIGDEFKTARLHLTKKLAGSAAWKGERRDRRPAANAPASEEVGDARAAA